MLSPSNSPKSNNVGTYVVQDSKNKEELQRVSLQSRMITTVMGGVLPEQSAPSGFHRVLDVACGTGEWVREAARTYPDMNLVGIDINETMIEYARAQAQEQGLTSRVEFQGMDVLKKFDFPDNSFDLVNLRFGMSFVRTWDWPPLLLEMQRIVRPSGIIRLTEAEVGIQCASQALTTMYEAGLIPLYRAGHLFTPDKAGLTSHLAELLTKSWGEDVQSRFYPLVFREGTPEGEMFKEDLRYLHITMKPFALKWGVAEEDYENGYQQSRKDMEQSNFSATWPHLTVWGRKPVSNNFLSISASSRREKKSESMPSSTNSLKGDNASTYMVQSNKKKEELQRLVLQSQMITRGTGGVLPEQPNAKAFRRVLDVACGTGGWVIEAAQTYPEMSLVGVDISVLMTDYARTQAQGLGLANRVEFRVMDALQKLDFPDNSFDLVNLRFGISFVRTWDWPPLLLEMQRVVRPGGIIRWGESEVVTQNTSPALTELYDVAMGAFYRAGHIFTQDTKGLTGHMAELLTKSWCENVQVKTYPLLFRAGTPEGEMYIDDVKYLYVTTTPFVQKWVGLPENYDALHRQSLKEMAQPDFSVTWPHVTAWGSKPLTESHTSPYTSASSRHKNENTRMASANDSAKDEGASTYMVQDSKKKAELQRQVVQGQLLTNAMGGVLPEQPDANAFRRILDVACGPGSWVLDTAKTYSEMNVVGIDINPMMTESARVQAQEQGLTDRIEFQVMDALKKLDFPDNTFDLVNLRFAVSFVRTWDWPRLLLEMQRVVRPGGIIRLTEGEISNPSTSPAFTTLSDLFVRALYQAGHLFTSESGGLTSHLAELLTKSWCEHVQVKAYPLIFRAGTPEGENFIEDTKLIYQTIRPFLQKSVGLPENYDALYRQVGEEMEQANFYATWPLVTVWGSKPLPNRK